jgi:hypothetical protein
VFVACLCSTRPSLRFSSLYGARSCAAKSNGLIAKPGRDSIGSLSLADIDAVPNETTFICEARIGFRISDNRHVAFSRVFIESARQQTIVLGVSNGIESTDSKTIEPLAPRTVTCSQAAVTDKRSATYDPRGSLRGHPWIVDRVHW